MQKSMDSVGIDRAAVMARAWESYRKYGKLKFYTFAMALRRAWSLERKRAARTIRPEKGFGSRWAAGVVAAYDQMRQKGKYVGD